jgi:hypothetical protein
VRKVTGELTLPAVQRVPRSTKRSLNSPSAQAVANNGLSYFISFTVLVLHRVYEGQQAAEAAAAAAGSSRPEIPSSPAVAMNPPADDQDGELG